MIINYKEVKDVMKTWKKEAGLKHPIMYEFDENNKKLIIYTSNPSILIGKAGKLVNKYTLILKSIMEQECDDVAFKEVNNWCF